MQKKMIGMIVIALVMSLWVGRQGWSQQKEAFFPTRQINYLICFDPGGQSDRVAPR